MARKLEVTEAADWNARYGIGQEVEVTRDDGSIMVTTTRTPAWVLGDGTAVVSVQGISGGYLLERVRAI